MRNIGKNIHRLRTQKHMTQDELAQKLFVTRQTVSNYENGKSKPDVGMLTQALFILIPMYFVYLGWLAGGLAGAVLKWNPKEGMVLRWTGWILAALLVIWFAMMVIHFTGLHIGWISRAVYAVYAFSHRIHVPHYLIYLFPGVALGLLGFPKR